MNGRYMQENELTISPLDHGFLYGLGFFETFRTFNGKVFLFEEHYNRLKEALARYRIAMPYNKKELIEIIVELNMRHNGMDGYFRLDVSAGNGGVGLQPHQYENPTVILFRKELPNITVAKNAQWLSTIRNTPEQNIRFKSHHYANNILARQELPSLNEIEVFFLNKDEVVAEGITSNIFWVTEGVLYTPSVDTGILKGITRQEVIRIAKEAEIKVVEGHFDVQKVEEATECFITTSIQGIVAIEQLPNKRFAGVNGEVYKLLKGLYEMRCHNL